MGFFTMGLLREYEKNRDKQTVLNEEEADRCTALTKAGNLCKNERLEDSAFCKVHQPKEEDEVM